MDRIPALLWGIVNRYPLPAFALVALAFVGAVATRRPQRFRRRNLPQLNRQEAYSLYIRSPEREAVRRRWKASRDNPGVLLLLMAQAWAVSWFMRRVSFPLPSLLPFVLAAAVWLIQWRRGKAMCLAGCTGNTQQQHISYWILNRARKRGLNMALPQDRQWVADREWRWRLVLFCALCPFHHRRVDKGKVWARLRRRHGGHAANVLFVLLCRARQAATVCALLAGWQYGVPFLAAHVVIR